MAICLQEGADLHMAQLMPLPLTVSCFSKIQIGFTFLVPAHPGSLRKGPLNMCVCAIYIKKYPEYVLDHFQNLIIIYNVLPTNFVKIHAQLSALSS